MLPITAVVSSPDGTKRRRIGSRGSWSEMLYGGGEGTNDIPCPRIMHAGVIWCNKLCIYGGFNGLRQMNDLHTFDFSSNLWKTTATSGFRQTCSLLIIFGGFDGKTALNGKPICGLRMSELS
jgi:hypothetical protein